MRSAINDYENNRIDEAKSKFLRVADSAGDVDPCVFEYLYLIAKYEDCADSHDAALWNEKFVDAIIGLAGKGDIKSQLKLADLHFFGDRVPPNLAYAREVYTRLAEKGVAEAQYRLATIYKHGQCELPADSEQYVQWLVASAENGFHEAEYELAMLLLSGSVVTSEDHAKALILLRRAAAQGYKMASAMLVEIERQDTGAS